MAETSTAEVVREREPAPADTAPPPAPPSAPSTPSDPVVAFGQWMASRDKEQQGLDARNAAMAPRIAQTQQALDTRVQQIAQNPPPPPPQLPPPPKRDLSAFLSPREGESAEASVQKLIQAIGLFAGGVGGLAKGDARGSLAAFTGALKGWNEGDIERGDRAFADWQAKTKTALTQWETERASYLDWLAVGNVSVDQMMRGLELQAMQSGNEQAAAAFRSGTLGEGVKFLQQQQQTAADFALARARIIEAHETRVTNEDVKRELVDLKRREVELKEREAVTGQNLADDATVDRQARQIMAGGAVMSDFVRGNRKEATAQAARIQGRLTQLMVEAGDSPEAINARRSMYQANKAALAKVTKDQADYESFLYTFEKNVQNALKLSEAYERGGFVPWNAAKLKADMARGITAAKDWDVAMEAVANEWARVVTRKTDTTVEARMAAREKLNAAQTREQFKSIIKNVLEVDAQNAKEGFENKKAVLLQSLGGMLSPAAVGVAPIVIERDANGKLVEKK